MSRSIRRRRAFLAGAAAVVHRIPIVGLPGASCWRAQDSDVSYLPSCSQLLRL